MAGDVLDQRIRALVDRAVQESPLPPTAAEVDRVGGALAAAPVPAAGRRPSGPRRRAVVVGIAAAVLAAGATTLALRGPGTDPSPDPRPVATRPAAPVARYLADGLPPGYRVVGWDDTPSTPADPDVAGLVPTLLPSPATRRFQRVADGLEVRVVLDLYASGDRSGGAATTPVAADDLAWLRRAFGGHDLWASVSGTDPLPATTVAGSAALEEVHPVLGSSGRPGVDYFLRAGRAVTLVSVFGATGDAARAALDGFTRAADGGVVPPAGDAYATVADEPGQPADHTQPLTRIAYGDGSGPDAVLNVVTAGLGAGPRDLLAVATHGGGSIEQWDGHLVLVRWRGAAARATFVEGDAVVSVLGPVAAVRTVVASVRSVDDDGWAAFVTGDGARVAALAERRAVDVGGLRLSERWDGTDAVPGDVQGLCLSSGSHLACRPKAGSGVLPGAEQAAAPVLVSTLVDGHWWIVGRTPSGSAAGLGPPGAPMVVADGTEPVVVEQEVVDGTTWFAARLADGASSATVAATGADGTATPVQAVPRPTT